VCVWGAAEGGGAAGRAREGDRRDAVAAGDRRRRRHDRAGVPRAQHDVPRGGARGDGAGDVGKDGRRRRAGDEHGADVHRPDPRGR